MLKVPTKISSFSKGGTETENLHRNMFPFVGIRELVGDVAEEEVRELQAKFMQDICAENLQCANYFMDTYFDEGL